tara:strand:+ start:245 stop:784 length:540 start_codon:yes stop_codon:yes gene_type:complete
MKTSPGLRDYSFEARPRDKIGRALFLISTCLTLFGGGVLLFIVCVSVLSICGRVVFSAPVLGDFELVEMGCAVAIFSFLPLCQLKNGNVIVDFFSAKFPFWCRTALDSFSCLLFGLVAAFFTWRMLYGVGDMLHYNEQTMLLKIPVWLAFIPAIFSFFLLSVVCFYSSVVSFRHLFVEK